MKRLLLVLLLGFCLAGCRERARAISPETWTARTLPAQTSRETIGRTPVPTAPVARTTPTPKTPSPADIPRIQARELWERLQAGESIVVVDVRSRQEYEQEHIAGAISLPLNELSRRAAELPGNRLLVFYCT